MADSNIAVGRSAFVTGLAWTFIALAGFATFISVMQNVMFTLMFPAEEMRAIARDSRNGPPMPGAVRFMFENFRYFLAAFLVLSAGTLISAIGLLKRKNWARLAFIAIMAIGVVWNLAGLAMPFVMTPLIPEMPGQVPPDFKDNFRLMQNIMIGFAVVMGLAFAGLFAWIIKRLVSDDIKREFLPR